MLQYVVDLARTHTAAAPHKATIVARWLHWIERSVPPRDDLPGGRLADPVELGTEQDNVIVELWRQAAVAAFLGRERELATMRE
ncbi:hypothetical protein FB00_13550 [Cellulosimicrobium funkei]|uniref:Uncharacterized protein n=1 Tax=Cellulosimicrobium funkei TaxID=264251 RepID=A0A0H2L1W2_9MICO|nr:hypothetical protein [Cellulosimicrobium funkei]KLN34197.1 hypothetical protein FB00_13550 [Cellulosimicrobium funkei]